MAHKIIRSPSVEEDKDTTYMNPGEQHVSSFTGFMNSIMQFDEKSKPYYFLSLTEAPSKAVVYTCLEKAVVAAKEKSMPFVQCIGDQPVYTFIVIELKTKTRKSSNAFSPFSVHSIYR